jgi:hypothetical protein
MKKLKVCKIVGFVIYKFQDSHFGIPRQKNHFHAVPIARSKVYYKDGNVGLFPSLNHVNVMSPSQVQDSKLTLFPLTTCMTKFCQLRSFNDQKFDQN